MTNYSIIFWLSILFLIYFYTWYKNYKFSKSKKKLICLIKKDLKHLFFVFLLSILLYWIINKYQEATDLSNIPEQKIDEKLFLPLSESKVKEFNNLKIK